MSTQDFNTITGIAILSVILNFLLFLLLIEANSILNWFYRFYAKEPRVRAPRQRSRLHRFVLRLVQFPVPAAKNYVKQNADL